MDRGRYQSVPGWCFLGLLVLLVLAQACSAAPPSFARLDLNQSQEYRNMTVESLETIDLMNLSLSRVTLHSTTGDGSDIKNLSLPSVRNIRRVFSSNTTTCHGNTLTILGALDSTVSGSGFEKYTVFTQQIMPVIQCQVPGTDGDVFLIKGNATTKNYNLSTLFESAERMYLLHTKGIAGIERTPGGGWAVTVVGGPWTIVTPLDFGKILLENNLTLDNFMLSSLHATEISIPGGLPPTPGEYLFTAFQYNPPPTGMITTYAAWPVIILDGDNPLDLSEHIYNKRSGENLTLTFINPTPVHNLSYVLIKEGHTYDAEVWVNMTALEESGDTVSLDLILSGNPFLSILRDTGLGSEDLEKVVSYSIHSIDNSTPPHSSHCSKINITPGYGTSGYALHNDTVTSGWSA